MTRDTLLLLKSSGAPAILLKRLKKKNPSVIFEKLGDDIDALSCVLVSENTYYLRVKVPYPTKQEPKACALFLIPHSAVLMIVMADREKFLGFSQAMIGK